MALPEEFLVAANQEEAVLLSLGLVLNEVLQVANLRRLFHSCPSTQILLCHARTLRTFHHPQAIAFFVHNTPSGSCSVRPHIQL